MPRCARNGCDRSHDRRPARRRGSWRRHRTSDSDRGARSVGCSRCGRTRPRGRRAARRRPPPWSAPARGRSARSSRRGTATGSPARPILWSRSSSAPSAVVGNCRCRPGIRHPPAPAGPSVISFPGHHPALPGPRGGTSVHERTIVETSCHHEPGPGRHPADRRRRLWQRRGGVPGHRRQDDDLDSDTIRRTTRNPVAS